MRRNYAAYVVIAAVAGTVVGCGPSVNHDGYRSPRYRPWKKPKVLELDGEGEAEVDDALNYPKRRRARWYAVDLPSFGQLTVKLAAEPVDEREGELDIALEILDSSYRSIEIADRDADDAGDLNKRRTLDDLDVGRYYIHVYTQERLDKADFALRIVFESARKAYDSTFPADVSYAGLLPAVPLFDDTPVTVARPRKVVRRRTDKKKPPKKAIRARISGISTTGKGTLIKINRGASAGVAKGWRGSVVSKSGRSIPNGRFTVSKVSSSESYGVVRATQDAVTSAKYVRLTPP